MWLSDASTYTHIHILILIFEAMDEDEPDRKRQILPVFSRWILFQER